MAMGLSLGLDLGIGSVGYGLIDIEDGTILEAGVRLFSSVNPENNQTRRGSRQARRLNRRKVHRLTRIAHLLEESGFFRGDVMALTPYHLRVKGLSEKLSREELYAALYNLAKHRGISYLEDVELDEADGSSLSHNVELLKEYYPCQIQMARYETYGQIRGIIETFTKEGEPELLVNIFPTSAYEKEARAILSKQGEFYPEIDIKFVESYIKILTDKRLYYVGPGNEKSRTDYGIYRENGETLDNLFDILIGKCTVYPDERRAAKFSYTAQLFDFLNDMNNLSIAGEKLTEDQKRSIYQQIMFSKTVNMMKIIMKVTGCIKEDIKGFRVDNKDKPEFHTFEAYRKFRNKMKEVNVDITTWSDADFDELAVQLTLSTEYKQIVEQVKKLNLLLSDEAIDAIADFRKKNGTLFSKWHSLSLKAMHEIMDDLWSTHKNQMQLYTELGVFKSNKDLYKGLKYIKKEMLLEEIYNPVVRSSISESIKVINMMLKKYGALDKIVLEMPRDANEKEEKKRLDQAKKDNKTHKDTAIKVAQEEYGFSEEAYRHHQDLNTKLRLWYEQGKCCLYSGKTIKVMDLIMNPNQFDIDHIIPKSISFDDSLNNKVLCYASENRWKGNQTPFRYFKRKQNSQWNYDKYKSQIVKLYNDGKGKLTRAKMDLLLFEEDINKYEVRRQFINRNLVDTRYASRVVLNTLQDFMSVNYPNTTVGVVRGKFTAQLRKHWGIKKDRDESHSHHAIDALTVACVPYLSLWKKQDIFKEEDIRVDDYSVTVNEETGEIIEDSYNQLAYQPPFEKFFTGLRRVSLECRYSYKVDRKFNRQVADATIYSTRQGVVKETKGEKKFVLDPDSKEHYVVAKIKNIYDDADAKRFMDRYKKDKTQFLMYHHDPQTFAILEDAIRQYSKEKNPFAMYREEHGPLQKYAKKGNGPEIRSVKYFDKKLGTHIELKQEHEKNRKVVLQSLNPWRSDIYYNKKENRYMVAGIKYADLSYQKGSGEYGISLQKYQQVLKSEKILLSLEELEAILNGESTDSNYEFCFSLYKNNLLQWTDEKDQVHQYRFLSRNLSNSNMIEVKPIEKSKYEKQALGMKTLKKGIHDFYKIEVDVLGYQYFIKREKLKLSFKSSC